MILRTASFDTPEQLTRYVTHMCIDKEDIVSIVVKNPRYAEPFVLFYWG